MTAPIDLRPDHLEIVQSILASHLPAGVSARVFGSRAKWTAKPYSDLDLALKGAEKIPSWLVADLAEEFSKSDLPFKVDVLDWHDVAPSFQAVVDRDGVLLPWPEYPLKSFVDTSRSICYGIVQPGTPNPSGVPIVRVNNFTGTGLELSDAMRVDQEIEANYRRSRLQGGELLVSLVGSLGQTAIAPPELRGWNVARAVGVVPLGDEADARWINFAIRSQPAQDFMRSRANTTVQATFNLKDLAELPIPYPPSNLRKPMSDLLAALDDKIELNRRMNATLERQARALFRDWFVDFGPTRAKQTGTPAYLAPHLWSLFPSTLDAEDRPEGWTDGSIADIGNLNPESWSVRTAPETVAYVDLSNTKWGYIESVEHYSWLDAPSRARRVLRSGDTIVGTVRPGNGSFAYVNTAGLTGSTGFAVLRPRRKTDRALVWCAATAPDNIDRLAHLADGGAYPAVRPEVVADSPIVVADEAIRDAFATLCVPIIDMMEANKAESRTLAQTRDLLLPKLMSGEIRVAEAEASVGSLL